MYLVPFREAITTAGALGVMAAYSEIDGIPNAANQYLLTDVLRKEWGFEGIVVSDLGAITMLYDSHFVAKSSADALKQFHSAGGNVQFYDVEHQQYVSDILSNIENDSSYRNVLKDRVREVLHLKEKLGLFENPYIDVDYSENQVNQPETQALALEASKESIILLKNDNHLLPLDYRKLQKIAVIGPNAAALRTGDYTPDYYNNYRTSILSGIRQFVKRNATIVHSWGCDISNDLEMVGISQDFLYTSKGERGLRGRYFNKEEDAEPVFSRIDSEIGTSWYLWAPRFRNFEIKDAEDFYVEWDGYLIPDVTVRGYIGLQVDGDKSSAKLFINDIEVSLNSDEIILEPKIKNLKDDGDFFKHWIIDRKIFGEDRIFSSSVREGPSFVLPFSFVKGEALKIHLKYKKNGKKGGIRLVWNLVGPHGIKDAIKAAAHADVAIVVLGDNDEIMGENR